MTSAADSTGPGADASGYIAREMAVSAAINAVISVGFFVAIFGFGASIEIWGLGKFAFDFLPQSLAVAFFASFVPSLLARKAMLAETLASATKPAPSVSSLFAKSILIVLAAVILGTAIWAAILWASGTAMIAPIPAFALKIAYGAALGAFVTRRRLQAMLE